MHTREESFEYTCEEELHVLVTEENIGWIEHKIVGKKVLSTHLKVNFIFWLPKRM